MSPALSRWTRAFSIAVLAASVAIMQAPAVGVATAATPGAANTALTTAPAVTLASVLAPPTAGVSRLGSRLLLNGSTHFFGGINAYDATTDWAVNWGCGAEIDNLSALFGSMPRGSLVRTWAFQALGYNNKTTHRIDFTGIDRVVAAAKAHGDYLILTLSDQAGTCDDGHYHDASWYLGGYKRAYNDDGRGLSLKLSYYNWVRTVVERYRSNDTVAVYEPVNEPEASNCNAGYAGGSCFGHDWCPSNATAALRSFFDAIGATIKSIDPRALVSSGTEGWDQCGVAGTGFATIAASRYLDIATMHVYGSDRTANPAGLSLRVQVARSLSKAIIIEEEGVSASTRGGGCMTLAQRAAELATKIATFKSQGGSGYLPWWYALGAASTTCSTGIAPGDPALKVL